MKAEVAGTVVVDLDSRVVRFELGEGVVLPVNWRSEKPGV